MFFPAKQRILQKPLSPDTVAWDNPFPTFPVKSKKVAHPIAGSLDGSLAKSEFDGGRPHDKNHGSRPQTSSSKSSNYTINQVPITRDETKDPLSSTHGYPKEFSDDERTKVDSTDQGGISRHRMGDRLEGGLTELKPPVLAGRHSEDSRTRLLKPSDQTCEPQYERSRTMPAALSDVANDRTNRPRPPLQTSWQEPGPNASYFGPEDRGFTPITPTEPLQQHRGKQARTPNIEHRPHGHAAIQSPASTAGTNQLHTPQDSFSDVFDHYYDGPSRDHPPALHSGQVQSGRPAEEGYANFDYERPSDKYHEPSHRMQGRGALPALPYGERQQYHKANHHAMEPLPRSRSQPDLKDRRSPRQQQHDEFNFSLPESLDRPPATAPAPGRHETFATGFDKNPGSRQMGLPSAHEGSNIIYEAASHTGQSAHGYQVNTAPGRDNLPQHQLRPYRPPVANGQRDRSHQGYRSPASQPPYGPTRPPMGRPSPHGPDMASDVPLNAYANHKPSPPFQNGHNRGMYGPPESKSPPGSRAAPASPPARPALNPDALPSHPVPIRQGLAEGPPSNQVPKPAPVRQYNTVPSPMQLPDPSQKPGGSRSVAGGDHSDSVTPQELDRLKHNIARNPDDLATQLLLAKKMVIVASAKVDEGADARIRNKNREKTILEAYKIVKKLSSNGYSEATFYLADSYTRGALGLESDTREAFKLYQTAAKSGHAQAAYRVAVCCEIGQEEGGGTSRDPVKAMQWYKRAATLGDTPAMYKMGIISLKGLLGQPRNAKEATVWLKRAADRADRENPHALHELVSHHIWKKLDACFLPAHLCLSRPSCTKRPAVMKESIKMKPTQGSYSPKRLILATNFPNIVLAAHTNMA